MYTTGFIDAVVEVVDNLMEGGFNKLCLQDIEGASTSTAVTDPGYPANAD